MSIATLKVKSYTLYGKSHSTAQGFALNGTLRHPPQNLGRSVTRTPFRGPTPMGHGMGSRCRVGGWRARTCGSSYPLNIHHACLGTLQTEIKRSTMNTDGMIEKRFMGILHGSYPRTSVYKIGKDSMTHIQKVSQGVLTCKNVITNEKNTFIQSENRCTPYTKKILDMDYEKYYLNKQSECSQTVPVIYKGITQCG